MSDAAAVTSHTSPRCATLAYLLSMQGHGGKEAVEERKAEEQQLQQQLVALRFKRTLRTLAVLQDIADAALAANDLRGDGLMLAGL
jgi:hypothetical protein